VAALVLDMLHILYLVKNHKIAYHSATTEAREKISAHSDCLELLENVDVFLTDKKK